MLVTGTFFPNDPHGFSELGQVQARAEADIFGMPFFLVRYIEIKKPF